MNQTIDRSFDWQRMLRDDFPVHFSGEVGLSRPFCLSYVSCFLKNFSGRPRRSPSYRCSNWSLILTLRVAAGDVSFLRGRYRYYL